MIVNCETSNICILTRFIIDDLFLHTDIIKKQQRCFVRFDCRPSTFTSLYINNKDRAATNIAISVVKRSIFLSERKELYPVCILYAAENTKKPYHKLNL